MSAEIHIEMVDELPDGGKSFTVTHINMPDGSSVAETYAVFDQVFDKMDEACNGKAGDEITFNRGNELN